MLWISLSLCLLSAQASAEWYIAGDILQARYQGPTVEGNWQQQLLPSHDGIPAVAMTKESLAWDVGLGYRFAGESWYSRLVSVEAGYRHYGAGMSAGGLAVSDELYGQMMRGDINPQCVQSAQWEATDRLQGGYLRLSKGFAVGYGFEPYMSGGVEVLYHDLTGWWKDPKGRNHDYGYTGMLAGPTIGGGVKYELSHGIKARVGAESHWMITESGQPITNHWLTVGAGIEVPLSIGSGSTREYLWNRKETL
jgi:opacity protein-like surface antigen